MQTARGSSSAAETIRRMRMALEVPTDQELAQRLNVSKQTVSAWKRRNSVPIRYIIEVASRTMTSVEHYQAEVDGPQVAIQTYGVVNEEAYGLVILFYDRTKPLVTMADKVTTAMWWGSIMPHLIQFYEYELQSVAEHADCSIEDAAKQIAEGISQLSNSEAIKILKARHGL